MNRDLLREEFVHVDAMYPISVCEINKASCNVAMDCHWHDELEVFILTEGKVNFQVDTDCFEVCSGQAVFINSGEIHSWCPCDGSRCNYNVIVFDTSILDSKTYDVFQEKYIGPILQKKFILPAHVKGQYEWEKVVLSQLTAIVNANKSKHLGYELSTKAVLYLILSEMYSNNVLTLADNKKYVDNYKVERIKSVLSYIHTNYNEKIRLKDLVELVNMSEGYFCRFFKEMMKKTPMEYLNCYRTSKAAGLLENSNKKVFEIALDVGFESFSYFIDTFKHYMSCTPSVYRKRFKM